VVQKAFDRGLQNGGCHMVSKARRLEYGGCQGGYLSL
jgi:hypothetical protein